MAKFLCVFLAVSVAIVAAQDHRGTNYNAGDSGRSETRNADGSVQGQYSYTDANGKLITVKYRAGKDGYQVEGDHLPKPPANPHPQPAQHQAPYNPHHQAAPQSANGYNPFHNPHVPAHLYQQAPQAPANPHHVPQAQQHSAQDYNPFHNPHVPAHLYQQAPQAPAAPQHAPQVQQHSAQDYNPFHNPHVPAHLYQQAPQAPQYQQPQPQQQQQYNGPAGTFPGFGNQQQYSHPNSIPGAPGGRGPIKVSVSQQPQGFTYNFETSN